MLVSTLINLGLLPILYIAFWRVRGMVAHAGAARPLRHRGPRHVAPE
jgi:hypothetical protein